MRPRPEDPPERACGPSASKERSGPLRECQWDALATTPRNLDLPARPRPEYPPKRARRPKPLRARTSPVPGLDSEVAGA
eukprot:13981693-Alexandrium_andersonii.AAC.1